MALLKSYQKTSNIGSCEILEIFHFEDEHNYHPLFHFKEFVNYA